MTQVEETSSKLDSISNEKTELIGNAVSENYR